MIDLNMFLSKNFKLVEFTTSPTADRHGISNLPTLAEAENLRTLCNKILQPARDALGPLKISSGFRSAKLNKLVGGVPSSDHRLGFAADVVPLETGTRNVAEWVVSNCPHFDQVILEFGTLQNPNWIHLSMAPRLRRQVLRATRKNGSTVYNKIKI
jgi:zinc D-Ala-D-Ala carboxypeptidase